MNQPKVNPLKMNQQDVVNTVETTLETWWQSLVGTALVGTDRQSPQKPSGDSLLDSVMQQLDWQNAEMALLKAAGMVAVYQQAGRQTSQLAPDAPSPDTTSPDDPTIKLAEPDTKPCCNARLAQHLKVGLERYPQAVPELLLLIADAGQRVPPTLLPAVLRYGEKEIDAHRLVEAVLGNRGRWLAAQNPAWQYVKQETVGEFASESDGVGWQTQWQSQWKTQWQSGSKQQRLAALSQWRQVDPDGAREAIAPSWTSEDWRTRENIVCTFEINLTMADEPFLEEALSDRAAGVQRSAAACLAQLSESRLCQRMAKRIQSFVHLSTTQEGAVIEVTLPKAFDTDWQKDGIKKTSLHQLSDQASWVAQMLARTPLSFWGQVQAEPIHKNLSHASMSQRDRLIFLTGWSQAASYQRTTQLAKEWAAMLLPQLGFQDWEPELLSDLLSILPDREKEQYLRAHVPKKANDQSSAHWLRLVAESDQKWDYEFSRLVLAQIIQVMQGKPKYGHLFSPSVGIALSLHPGLAPEAERRVDNWMQNHRPTKAWQRFLDDFLGMLTYRWQMYQLFADSG